MYTTKFAIDTFCVWYVCARMYLFSHRYGSLRTTWVWVFTFCLVGGSISRCSLQRPGFNFLEFS